MAMPTTRYGRYLYYRARQQRRLHRARSRGAYVGLDPITPNQHRVTSRDFDLSGFTVQAPRVYPLNYRDPAEGPWYDPSYWSVSPRRGRWGVPLYLSPFDPLHPNTHQRGAILLYQKRRLLSIPRLRHLPRKPWLFDELDVPEGGFYPYQFYPSGQLNEHWTPPPP